MSSKMPADPIAEPGQNLSRYWCALIQYPDLEPIYYGTVMAPLRAPDHEVEAALTSRIRLCLPDGWKLINMVPGSIFFVPEVDA